MRLAPAGTWRGSFASHAWLRAAAYLAVPWAAWALPGPADVFTFALTSVLAAAVLSRHPQDDAPVLLLVAAFTVCDLSPLSYEGSVVRLYQLAFLQVLVVTVRRRRELWSGLMSARGASRWLLAVMAVITVVTPVSLLWSIAPRQTVVSSVGQFSASGLLFVFCAAVLSGLLSARSCAAAVWAMATVSSVWGVVQFLVTLLTPLELVRSGGSGVPWPRPEGLMTESVWAALVAATGLGLAAVVYRSHRRLALWSLPFHVVTLALVLSRAVILGLAVGALVAVAVSGRRYLTTGRVAAATVAVLAVVGAAWVIAPAQLERFDPRLVLGMQGSDGGSAASRGAVYELVADELPKHLPLGAGAGSLNELTSDPGIRDRYIDGGELNSGRGSTNFFVGYTFDFGPAGAVLALALVALAFVVAFRVASLDHGVSLFLTSVYVVDFQFNNGFRFGFVHLLLGVAVGTASLVAQDRSNEGRERQLSRFE